MTQTITVTDELYHGLQQYAQELHVAPDLLAQRWLRQALQLQQYPDLEWRDGPGGPRVGIKGAAIDVYTVVGYVQAGYTPQALVTEILPQLTPTQIATALRYYADYPQEIDQVLADNEPNASRVCLQRMVDTVGFGTITRPRNAGQLFHEERATYDVEP